MGGPEDDEARHKREQQKLREKRKAAHSSKLDSERHRKRKEHQRRVLEEQRKKQKSSSGGSGSGGGGGSGSGKSPDGAAVGSGGTTTGNNTESAFQQLFQKRAEGFVIDLQFRNAPPRPPVGPTFVGQGLEGELINKWTEYRPGNGVEMNHMTKLHPEPDLGVTLGAFAMDLHSCYTVPKHAGKRGGMENKSFGNTGAVSDDDHNGEDGGYLHPDDDALLNWKGSMGDTAAEELKIRRERARALAIMGAKNLQSPTKKDEAATPSSTKIGLKDATTTATKDETTSGVTHSTKKKPSAGGFKSRVLDEKIQSWMKKTTYLSNDQYRSVHQFKSLAQTKMETAKAVERGIEEQKKLMLDPRSIEYGFDAIVKDATKRKKHPTKKNVTAIYDFPLLPDVSTWGHTFTHVVLDNPPKALHGRPVPTADKLERSYISDVQTREDTGRMTCNLLVPEDDKDKEGEDEEKEKKDNERYDVAQQYDLDVLPLKQGDTPHTNFLLVIDEEKGVVRYHPVSSRVQLSTGRPGRRGYTTMVRCPLDEDEMKEYERRTAEVDHDLAEKHGV